MNGGSPGRVTIEPGVRFDRAGDRDLLCDIYHPPAQSPGATGVLLIHGGGWAMGDRSQLRGYGVLLGRKGYVCVACEYRLSGEAQWPAQLHDVTAALRWMRSHAPDLGIDPAKIAVSGNSAGGHLALMLAGTQDMPAFEGKDGRSAGGTTIAAVCAFYAPTMLGIPGAELSPSVAALLGGAASEEAVREASPLTYVRPGYPPTLLMHGAADDLVPMESSLRLHAALTEAGAPVELHVFAGAPHAFDAIPEFGRQCVEVVALFLDRHVVNPRPAIVPALPGG